MSHNALPETQKGSARDRPELQKFQGELKSQLLSKTISANTAGKVHRRNFSNDFHLATLTGSILSNKLVPSADLGTQASQKASMSETQPQQPLKGRFDNGIPKNPTTRPEHRRTQSNTSEQLALYQRAQPGMEFLGQIMESGGEYTKLGPAFAYLEHGERQRPSLIGSGSIPANNFPKQFIDTQGSTKMIKSKGANFKRQKKPTDTSEGNYSSGNSLLPSNSQIITGQSQHNKSNNMLSNPVGMMEKTGKGPTSVSTGHGLNTGTSNHAPASGGSITTASSSGDMNSLTGTMFRDTGKKGRESNKKELFGVPQEQPRTVVINLDQESGNLVNSQHQQEGLPETGGLLHPNQESSPAQKGLTLHHLFGAMQLACASSTGNPQQPTNMQYMRAINAMKKPKAMTPGTGTVKVPTVIDTRSPVANGVKPKTYAFSNLSHKGGNTSSKSNLAAQKVSMNTTNIGAIAASMVSAAKANGMLAIGMSGKKAGNNIFTTSSVHSHAKHVRNPSAIVPSTISQMFNSPIEALLKGGVTIQHRRVQSGDKLNLRGLLQKGSGKSTSKSGSQQKKSAAQVINQGPLLKKSLKTEIKASNFLLNENMLRSQAKTHKPPNPSTIFTKKYFKRGSENPDTDRHISKDTSLPGDSKPETKTLDIGVPSKQSPSLDKPKQIVMNSDAKPPTSAPRKIHHRKIASLPVSNITSKFFQELNLPIAYPVKGNTMTPDESRRNTPRARSPRVNADPHSAFGLGVKDFHFEEHDFLQPPKNPAPKQPDAYEFYGEEPQDLNSHRNYTSFVIEEDLDEIPDIDPGRIPESVHPPSRGQVPTQNIRIPERGESGQDSGMSTPHVMSKSKPNYSGFASGQQSVKVAGVDSRESNSKLNTQNNVQIAMPGMRSSNSPSVSSAGFVPSNPGFRHPQKLEQNLQSHPGQFPYSKTRNNSAANIHQLGSSSQLEDKEIVLDFCNLSQEELQDPDHRKGGGKLHTTEESSKANHQVKLISPGSRIPNSSAMHSNGRSPSPGDFKLGAPSAPVSHRQQSGDKGLPNANLQLMLPTPGSDGENSDYNCSDRNIRGAEVQAVKDFTIPDNKPKGGVLHSSPMPMPISKHMVPSRSQASYNSRDFRRQGSEGNYAPDEVRRRDSRAGLNNQDNGLSGPDNRIYSEQNSYRDNYEEAETVPVESLLDGPPRIPPPRPNAPKHSRFHKFEEVFSDKNEVPLVLQKLLLVDKIKSFYTREKTRDIQTTLDFYKIIKLIGKGNFGKVYRAVSVLTGKEVAIKKFEKADIQNDQAKQRIFQEAGNMKRLSHHNIAKLYEVFENRASIFYVMEYATEGDLLNLIETRGPLDEDSARFIAVQIVHGLKHCHSKGVLHRDIKLDNILLSDNFVVKICDFGISKLVKKGEVMTEDSGTAVYIAPEVITGKGYSGFQSDIWSLGVTLYIVLTGRMPFKPPANQSSEVLHQLIKKGEFTFPENIPLSPDVQDLIKQMLCVNPEKRITVDQIMKHPWFNRKIIDRFTTFLKDQSDEASSDHALRKLQELGFPEPSIKKAVNEQYLNHIYCCYQIYKHS